MTPDIAKKPFLKRTRLLLVAVAAAGLALVAKWVTYGTGWQVISVNLLLSAIVAADVFLISSLLSGVWSDYKESEKLPGEIASSLESLSDEAIAIQAGRHRDRGTALLVALRDVAAFLSVWFKQEHQTPLLSRKLEHVNELFIGPDPEIPANFVARMKQEVANIRRVVTRIRTIRSTEFASGGYLIAQVTTALVVVGLILARIEPPHESLFFVGVITLLLVYMILPIKDLDDPFGFSEKGSTQDVPLCPVTEVAERLRRRCIDVTTGSAAPAAAEHRGDPADDCAQRGFHSDLRR